MASFLLWEWGEFTALVVSHAAHVMRAMFNLETTKRCLLYWPALLSPAFWSASAAHFPYFLELPLALVRLAAPVQVTAMTFAVVLTVGVKLVIVVGWDKMHCRFRCLCRNYWCCCRPLRGCRCTVGRRCWQKCYTSVANCVELSFCVVLLIFLVRFLISTTQCRLDIQTISLLFRLLFLVTELAFVCLALNIWVFLVKFVWFVARKHRHGLQYIVGFCFVLSRSIAVLFHLSWIGIIVIHVNEHNFLLSNISRLQINW